MVAGSFTNEGVSTVGLDRLWKAGVHDVHNLVPKIMPEFISSVTIIEGDGGVGTVKQFNFTEAVKEFSFAKDRVEVLDNENHMFKYTVIEGGLIGLRMKSYSFEIKFEATANGCVSKVTVEYDTLDDTPLTGEEQGQVIAGVVGMMKGLEGYLLANPSAYA